MRESINKRTKDDFTEAFMLAYQSPGINIPMIRMAYGKAFEVVEQRSSYKVTIRGTTRRFTNLCLVAEYIYNQNFDPMHIYIPPKSDYEKRKRVRKKNILRLGFYSGLIGIFKKTFLNLKAA